MTAADILEQAKADGRSALSEAEAKDLFSDIGIPVPDYAVVSSAEEATSAASDIGYPVVAKVASPDVQHKSEWAGGLGVQVGLEDEAAVRDATDDILSAASEQNVDANVLIEKQLDTEAGTELIVGGIRDRSFGPAVLVGLGGVFTEIFEDTSHRLAPLPEDEALAAIEELQAVDLLRGYRSLPPADLEAIAATVSTVGDLLTDYEAISEVDVNPLLAEEDGVIALDALVTLSE